MQLPICYRVRAHFRWECQPRAKRMLSLSGVIAVISDAVRSPVSWLLLYTKIWATWSPAKRWGPEGEGITLHIRSQVATHFLCRRTDFIIYRKNSRRCSSLSPFGKSLQSNSRGTNSKGGAQLRFCNKDEQNWEHMSELPARATL